MKLIFTLTLFSMFSLCNFAYGGQEDAPIVQIQHEKIIKWITIERHTIIPKEIRTCIPNSILCSVSIPEPITKCDQVSESYDKVTAVIHYQKFEKYVELGENKLDDVEQKKTIDCMEPIQNPYFKIMPASAVKVN